MFRSGRVGQLAHAVISRSNDVIRHIFEFFELRHAGQINEARSLRESFREDNCIRGDSAGDDDGNISFRLSLKAKS